MKMYKVILSVVAVSLCLGCKRPADSRMEKFAETVKQKVDPVELQSWAGMVISNTPRDRVFKGISIDTAPKGIQGLMTNWATLEVMMDGSSNNLVVVYSRGSGFGHWGFSVGVPPYRCEFGHTQLYWTNGIWFWTE